VISVYGAGFVATNVTAVRFGSNGTVTATIVSSTMLLVVSPPSLDLGMASPAVAISVSLNLQQFTAGGPLFRYYSACGWRRGPICFAVLMVFG
jgi:hypothetical protein